MSGVSSPLVIAILAAGGSRRLGRPKQLEPIGDAGERLVHRQCRVACEAAIGPVGLVVGAYADACRSAVADLDVTLLPNPDWAEGLSRSLACAVAFARDRQAGGLLILLGDQYAIDVADLRAVARTWHEHGMRSVVAARLRDNDPESVGPPAVFPSACFDALCKLQGDVGAKAILAGLSPISIDLARARLDLDTDTDASAARAAT